MVRLVLTDMLMLAVLLIGTISFVEELQKEGFHWFKTPAVACCLMLGYLCIFYKLLEAVATQSRED